MKTQNGYRPLVLGTSPLSHTSIVLCRHAHASIALGCKPEENIKAENAQIKQQQELQIQSLAEKNCICYKIMYRNSICVRVDLRFTTSSHSKQRVCPQTSCGLRFENEMQLLFLEATELSTYTTMARHENEGSQLVLRAELIACILPTAEDTLSPSVLTWSAVEFLQRPV